MNIQTLYKFSGYLSIIIGIAATMCMYRIQYLYYGVGLSIIGFIFSGMNIFLNAKYFNEYEKYPKGYFGMLLSSLPVIFIMLVIFKFQK
jgi:hypothetical protein